MPEYRRNAEELVRQCRRRDVGTMIIKAVAKGPWGDKIRKYNPWYEPFDDPEMIQKGVNFSLSQDVTGVAVSDVDIIASDRDQGPPSETGYNNAVVGCRNLNGATMSQLSFERVRLEASPYQLFGIRIQDTMTGFDSGLGSVEGLLFKDWVVAAMPLAVSVFDGNGTQTGEIKTVTFDSVVVDGTAIDGTIESTYLVRQGLTSDFQYP